MKTLPLIHFIVGAVVLILLAVASMGWLDQTPLWSQYDAFLVAVVVGAAALNMALFACVSQVQRYGVWCRVVGSVFAVVALLAAVFAPFMSPLMMADTVVLAQVCTALAAISYAAAVLLFSDKISTAAVCGLPLQDGVVKWFNVSKGFGFITIDGDRDVFVHFRAIRGTGHRILMEGQKVRFTMIETDKGLQAEDVHPL